MTLALVRPLFSGDNLVGTVVTVIAVIIGGGLLVFALKTAITHFVSDPWKPKAMALMYIIIALILAVLVFRWAGLM